MVTLGYSFSYFTTNQNATLTWLLIIVNSMITRIRFTIPYYFCHLQLKRSQPLLWSVDKYLCDRDTYQNYYKKTISITYIHFQASIFSWSSTISGQVLLVAYLLSSNYSSAMSNKFITLLLTCDSIFYIVHVFCFTSFAFGAGIQMLFK
jgi:hypothetical protein